MQVHYKQIWFIFGSGFFHVALKKSKHFENELIELFTKNCYELRWKKWKEGTNALKAKFISLTFPFSAFQTVFPSFHGSLSRFFSPTDFNWGRVLF